MSLPYHEPKEGDMSVQVYIPTPFRRATNNQDRLSLEAPDVETLLDELAKVNELAKKLNVPGVIVPDGKP